MTRSAMLTASPMSWVTRIAVLPSRRRICATSSASARRVCESSAENGSSSSTTSGSVQSVRASATRWRMPPDNCRGRWLRNWPSPYRVSNCDGALAGAPHVEALDFSAEQRVVEDGSPLEQVVLLQHVADLAGRPRHRHAVDQHFAFGRLDDAGDHRQQVLLPQPLGPMMAANSPGAMLNEMSFSASVSPPRPK